MNNLSDEYYSTIRKAGQLLKIISCKHSIFQPMALQTHLTLLALQRGSPQISPRLGAEAALQNSLSTSPWLFCSVRYFTCHWQELFSASSSHCKASPSSPCPCKYGPSGLHQTFKVGFSKHPPCGIEAFNSFAVGRGKCKYTCA